MNKQLLTLLTGLVLLTFKPMAQNKLSPGDHYATVNGLTMHYFVEGKGPVCLFPSPGWGASVDFYKHMASLVSRFTVVFYDTRHTGKTTGPSDYKKYTGAYFTEDMDALRQYLGQEKVWVAGHSGGGFQVLRYGIYYNEHLKGIIAIGALACVDSVYYKESARRVQMRAAEPYYTQQRANLMLDIDTTPRTLAALLKEIMPFYFHDVANVSKLPKYFTLNDTVAGYTGKAGLFGENLLPNLHKITVPVLVIVGDDDIVCNVTTQSSRIYQELPGNGSLSVINNSGHMPWMEQPQAFDTAIDAWLKGIEQEPSGK